MILVTGASGFLGRAIVRRLRDYRFKVRAFVRPTSDIGAIEPLGVDLTWGDVRDPAALSTALSGATTVVHCAGIIRERQGATFEEVHVAAVKRLVEAARPARIKRIVLLSATAARPDAPTRYGRTKHEGERIVRESGIDYLILRLSVVIGPQDQLTSRFASIMRWNPLIPLVGGGSARVQPIHVDDVVSVVVYAVAQDRVHDETVDLCGPESLSLRDLVRAIARAIGTRVLPFPIPESTARPAIALVEKLLPDPPVTREMLDVLHDDRPSDPARSRELFGIEPRPVDAALEHLRAWRN